MKNGTPKEIFLEARELENPEQRAAFLETACAGDPALRERVEHLLKEFENIGTFLEQPAVSAGAVIATEAAKFPHPPGAAEMNEKIGRYKLLERIGEGGCGVVYVAEQQEPVRRRVALKIIKLGMDTRSVVARFEAERQALALMDHPNIARVLDAGATESGRPFFVMELVRGIRITGYCDENQLSTRERLELMTQVCRAVQHAHQKGIIHRDLKPSNVLVTVNDGVAVPKVIDFGIAKATTGERLTDKTLYTAFEQFIGTPAYMSPEQATMTSVDIDTRSDIYSLGVLLYELLTSHTPFDTKELLASGFDQMRRTILEKEPVRPSTRLARDRAAEVSTIGTRQTGIDRDLDWIVMKCLEKDRSRRYETANGLAMDLQRYLDNEPVVARPPSVLGYTSKFYRRNRVVVIAAAAVSGALLLGSVVSAWLAIRANANERKALRAEAKETRLREEAQAQKAVALRTAYDAEMAQAYHAVEEGNLGRARELLDRQRREGEADLRGWEWHHLQHRTRGDELFALTGHSNAITGVGFLQGRRLLSVADDNTLRFWDFATRTQVGMLTLQRDQRHGLGASRDGRRVAVSGDRWWSVYDVDGPRHVYGGVNAFDSMWGLAFSPNGEWLAVSARPQIQLIDLHTGQVVGAIPRDVEGGKWISPTALAFSPDCQLLAYAHMNGTIQITNLTSHMVVIMHPERIAQCLAFTADSRYLISGGPDGLDVWDPATGGLVKSLLGHKEAINSVAVSPDGKLFASGGVDQSIRLWDTTSWSEVRVLRGHARSVNAVAFSPDSNYLVSGGGDDTLRVWDVRNSAIRRDRFRSADDAPFNWPFAPGNRVALVHGNLAYAPANMNVPQPVRARLQALGNQGAVTYLDCVTLEESPPEATPPEFSLAQVLAFGPEAKSLALGWPDGRIEVWQTQPFRRQRVIEDSAQPAVHLTFSDSGRHLAMHRRDGTLEILQFDSGGPALRLPPLPNLLGGYNCLFWAADRILTRAVIPQVGVPARIEVWRLPELELKVYDHPRGFPPAHAISNGGRLLATGGDGGVLRLWDIERQQVVETITGQLTGYTAVVFSPDDTRLVAGANDGTITIWDVETRQQVARWKAHDQACYWLRFVDGDQGLVSLGDCSELDRFQGEIRVWRAPRLQEIQTTKRTP